MTPFLFFYFSIKGFLNSSIASTIDDVNNEKRSIEKKRRFIFDFFVQKILLFLCLHQVFLLELELRTLFNTILVDSSNSKHTCHLHRIYFKLFFSIFSSWQLIFRLMKQILTHKTSFFDEQYLLFRHHKTLEKITSPNSNLKP